MSGPSSWPIVDVVQDILDPATDRLLGGKILGHELVDETGERVFDEFGNDLGPEAGRLEP